MMPRTGVSTPGSVGTPQPTTTMPPWADDVVHADFDRDHDDHVYSGSSSPNPVLPDIQIDADVAPSPPPVLFPDFALGKSSSMLFVSVVA